MTDTNSKHWEVHIPILKEDIYTEKNAANIKVFKVIFDTLDVIYLQETYKF